MKKKIAHKSNLDSALEKLYQELKSLKNQSLSYEPMCGDSIQKTVTAIVKMAKETGEEVTALFNSDKIKATPTSTEEQILKAWNSKVDKRRKKYLNSQEYKDEQNKWKL